MYIAVLSNGYPSDRYKSNGIFELDQAKALADFGCKVVFMALDLRSIRRIRKWGLYKEEKEGVYVYILSFPLGKWNEKLFYKLGQIAFGLLFRRVVKDLGRPDLIHAHFTEMSYIASSMKEKIMLPLITTEHSSLINQTCIPERLRKLAEYAYEKSDALIAVSPALAMSIKQNFSVNPIYVPNIVDINLFNYKEKKSNNEFNFISTGNLIPIKNMESTIEAFHRAFKENSNVKLTIFGEGILRNKLEKMIEKYGLTDRVILRGMKTRKEIAGKMNISDAFVLASKSETFGVSYIEALACGVPVIATKCGGPETFVDDTNGILVPVNDVEELKTAMLEIFNNNSRYEREIISKNIRKLFSPSIIAEQLTNIYSKNI